MSHTSWCIIPVLVRNETYSALGSPPSQPSPIKGEGVLMVDLNQYHFKLKEVSIPVRRII